MDNLTDVIRKLRLKKGYSQHYMATQLGISRQSYMSLEKGKTKISTVRLHKLAEILEIDVQFFFTNTKQPFEQMTMELDPKSAVEEAKAPYYRSSILIEVLQKENEMLRQQLADKEKIIKLLESKL